MAIPLSSRTLIMSDYYLMVSSKGAAFWRTCGWSQFLSLSKEELSMSWFTHLLFILQLCCSFQLYFSEPSSVHHFFSRSPSMTQLFLFVLLSASIHYYPFILLIKVKRIAKFPKLLKLGKINIENAWVEILKPTLQIISPQTHKLTHGFNHIVLNLFNQPMKW